MNEDDYENEESTASIKKRKVDISRNDISFDVRGEYQKNCKEIYEKLSTMKEIIKSIDIIKLIAEYSSSVKTTCINCEKFDVYVDDDAEEWQHNDYIPKLIAVDEELSEVHCNTVYTVTKEDKQTYHIVNGHRILSGKYNAYRIVCDDCYDEEILKCSNCNEPCYGLNCEGCGKYICHKYECSNVRESIRVSGPDPIENSYLAVCGSCTCYYN